VCAARSLAAPARRSTGVQLTRLCATAAMRAIRRTGSRTSPCARQRALSVASGVRFLSLCMQGCWMCLDAAGATNLGIQCSCLHLPACTCLPAHACLHMPPVTAAACGSCGRTGQLERTTRVWSVQSAECPSRAVWLGAGQLHWMQGERVACTACAATGRPAGSAAQGLQIQIQAWMQLLLRWPAV
jgi:hypothetical protein